MHWSCHNITSALLGNARLLDFHLVYPPQTVKTPGIATPERLSVLCIEDNPDDADLARLTLARAVRTLHWRVAEDGASMRQQLAHPVDLVLCDYHLPRFSPQRALDLLAELAIDVPLVVVTRAIGEHAAVSVLRAGAADYVAKDRLATLPVVVQRVLEAHAGRRRERQLLDDLHGANDRLRRLSAQLVTTQEAERRQIGRDLHDSLGQLLTAAQLHLQAAGRTTDPRVSTVFSDKAQDILALAVEQVKTLSFSMRPAQLDLLGLAAAVQALAEQMLPPGGVQFELSVRGDERLATPVQQSVAYRIVQETMTNTVRHAQALRLKVRLAFDRQKVAVIVFDDGIGLPRLAPTAALRPPQGLASMQERCELIGGRLKVRSIPGRGTLVHARI